MDALIFRVRKKGDAHPSMTVRAEGSDPEFRMHCQCLASLRGTPVCPNIAAVLCENLDLVIYGRKHFDELQLRSHGNELSGRARLVALFAK